MRLFGEKGYEATTVAEIEAAAGLTPGSGGLYRRFRSKADLLAAGVLHQIGTVTDLIATVDDPESLRQRLLRERLAFLAEAGLRRLDAKRDLSRILHRRDLIAFPDLLEALRDEDLRRVFRSVTHWFEAEAGEDAPKRDWQAIAAVLVGAIAHYWLLRDAIGGDPDGVDEDRYRAAWIEIGLLLLSKQQARNGESEQ
jgi:AcrR family transcriptional regulator